jgi:FKBP-type peptidyl-prolyl cis-trans isomerase FkpA
VKPSGSTGASVILMAVLLVVSAMVAGCDDTPVTPSSPEYSQTDLRLGTGAEAVSGSAVSVTYTGWFYDVTKSDRKGLVFDTTAGRDPLTFTLGIGAVITGWEQGLIGMKVGGARRLILPPSLAYGSNRYASIPPNSTLIFDIELVEIHEPPAVTAVNPASGSTAGGTAVTITGSGFVSGATVAFGSTAATNVTWVSSTSITATAPAHAAGSVDVVVTNPIGLSGSLTSGFTYVAPASAAAARGR